MEAKGYNWDVLRVDVEAEFEHSGGIIVAAAAAASVLNLAFLQLQYG